MKKYFFSLLFLVLSIVTHAQKIEYLVKPTLELDAVSPFNEGMALIQSGSAFTFLNNKGKQVTPFQYNMAYDFYNGLAVVLQKDEWSFINKKGEKAGVADKVVKNITDGLRWTNEDMKFYLIDTVDRKLKVWKKHTDFYGNESPPEEVTGLSSDTPSHSSSISNKTNSEYEEQRTFKEGLKAVKKNGKWGFIDKNGEVIVPIEYIFVNDYNEGFAGVILTKEILDEKTNVLKKVLKWGFIDGKGNVIIPFLYDTAESFHEGLVGVVLNHKIGFIDKIGKVVIPFVYDYRSEMRFDKNGLVPVFQNNKHGVINKLGQTVLPFQYDNFIVYYNTLAPYEKSIPNLYAWVILNGKWGGIDINGKPIIPIEFNYPGGQEIGGVIRMIKNSKVGYVNYQGETIVSFVFDYDDYLQNGLVKIKKDKKNGMADKTGKVIIPFDNDYNYFGAISENLIRVTLKDDSQKIIKWDGKEKTEFNTKNDCIDRGLVWVSRESVWGALNEGGDLVIPFEYDEMGRVNEETRNVRVRKNGKMGLVDTLGRTITSFLFDEIGSSNGDLLSASRNGFWGVVDVKGNILIPLKYEEAYVLSKSQDIIRVKRNNEYQFFNREGKEISNFSLASSNFSYGLAWAIKNNKRGFIDKTGKIVIPFEYDGVYNFSDGLAWVSKNGQKSFINKSGKVVIPLQNEDSDSFSDGFARVFREGKYCSFIDTSGKIALNLPFDYALSFSEGLAWVKKDNKWGCVDKTGKIVIPIQFDDTEGGMFYYFSERLAWVRLNGKWGIIKNPLSKN